MVAANEEHDINKELKRYELFSKNDIRFFIQ